ncbi:UNVERIFIED_CONTAM: hypothetical protein GTU68_039228 [Idotea baltica]|nr:hypothetical protein [Idotea baltica]
MIGCNCVICTSSDRRDRRLRSSVMISSGDTNIIIDCGPDFRQQILASGQYRIHGLLLTHEHSDHVSGLDDLRAINYKMGRDMPIYLNADTAKSIKKRFHYAFSTTHSGVPKFELHEIAAGDQFRVGDITIEALQVMHGRLPILGYRIGDLVYLTDVKTVSDKTIDRIRGCSILVMSALRTTEHPAHASYKEALELIGRVAPGRAYLTHISHQLYSYEDLLSRLPQHIRPAYDGLELDI